MLNHPVGVDAEPGLALRLRLKVGPDVHARAVEPDEEWALGLLCALDEVYRGGEDLLVDGFHALSGERPGVLDSLPALTVGPGVEHATWAELLAELGVLGIVWVLGLLFGIEVVKVAEELVEPVHRW